MVAGIWYGFTRRNFLEAAENEARMEEKKEKPFKEKSVEQSKRVASRKEMRELTKLFEGTKQQ